MDRLKSAFAMQGILATARPQTLSRRRGCGGQQPPARKSSGTTSAQKARILAFKRPHNSLIVATHNTDLVHEGTVPVEETL